MLTKTKCILGISLAALLNGVAAREVETGADGKRDWNRIERLKYIERSLKDSGPALVAGLQQTAPHFTSAANANTQANRPGEYTSLAQRNAYYDLISLVIAFEPTTHAEVKPVRFFDATTIVTLRSMLGFPAMYKGSGVEDLAKSFSLCFAGAGATKDFIEQVNVKLFAVNMSVINNLLFKWKRPQHPSSGNPAKIDPYDFDLAMVDLEQSVVEQELKTAKPPKAVIDEINKLFSCADQPNLLGGFLRRYSVLGDARKWSDNARGAGVPFDFSVQRHRVLLGKALVTLLHKKPESDFRKAVGQ